MMDPNMMLQLQQQQLLQQQQSQQGPQSYLSMMPASRGSEPNLNSKAGKRTLFYNNTFFLNKL